MYKSNVRLFFIAFILVITLVLFTNVGYSFLTESVDEMKVVFTNDTKELKDTKDVKLEVKNNENVAKGKIAPGMTAEADIEIEVTGTKEPVEIELRKSEPSLCDAIEMSTIIDGEEYTFGDTAIVFQKGSKIIVIIRATFEETSLDSIYGQEGNTYSFPMEITVREHI